MATKFPRDNEILKWSGALGHEFVGIDGTAATPRCACETNSLEAARRLCTEPTLRVYRRGDGRKKVWLLCFDASEVKVTASEPAIA